MKSTLRTVLPLGSRIDFIETIGRPKLAGPLLLFHLVQDVEVADRAGSRLEDEAIG